MGVIRGGLLASTGALALMAGRFASFGRVPDGEQGGGGGAGAGAGGAGELEEDFFGEAGAAGGASGEGAAGGEGAGGEGAGGEGGGGEGAGGEGGEGAAGEKGAVAEWMKSFSGEKPAEGQLSNQEWLAKIGVKDLDDVVNRYRAAEKGLRDSGKVKIPGEGATEAEVKAFREAIGAPAEAAGYEVALPEGASDVELDAAFIDPFREIAHKHAMPAAAFKDLASAFMTAQYGDMVAEAAKHNTDKAAKIKEWGPTAEEGKEEFRRGLQVVGLKVADVQKIQTGYGAGPTLDLFRKLGQLAGEDFFAGNGQRPADRFGVADAASAEKAINAMIQDKDTAAKLRAKDPVAVARYNRLTDALAHYREIEAKPR